MQRYICCETPIGPLYLVEQEDALAQLWFGRGNVSPGAEEKKTPLLRQVCKELGEYFEGKRREFTFPIAPQGTPFQQRVWQALGEIPYGETRSYKQVAEKVGNPKAVRAVGMANNRNPIAIIIPCHRVVGSDGKLVGYAGGLDVKAHLLGLEQGEKQQSLF